ncbi:tRNA pseudouridine(55) synthase TruB [Texcoconibacillus texcoconensis]|uniref:tRNA pseudouridine(55) synthase TruB n=1 Tax=Texcoconibacillus texcoconensis TaxID=1095777 RepID=UPI003CCDDCF2
MSGVIPFWKQRGETSFDCVKQIRERYGTKKVGHTGTLDPEVDGVLPICLGTATKLVEYLTEYHKTYEGEVTIGRSTTTEDATGEVVAEKRIEASISEAEIEKACEPLRGRIKQIPPYYSAVKVKGKRLYEYAREGIEVERPEREVTIYSLTLTGSPDFDEERSEIRVPFRVTCSKGTYVRTLAVAIGEALGYPAHMSQLTRTSAGPFTSSDCWTIEQIDELVKNNQQFKAMDPIEKAMHEWPSYTIDEKTEASVRNGAVLPMLKNVDEQQFALYNQQGSILAIYQQHPNKRGFMKPEKMLLGS